VFLLSVIALLVGCQFSVALMNVVCARPG